MIGKNLSSKLAFFNKHKWHTLANFGQFDHRPIKSGEWLKLANTSFGIAMSPYLINLDIPVSGQLIIDILHKYGYTIVSLKKDSSEIQPHNFYVVKGPLACRVEVGYCCVHINCAEL